MRTRIILTALAVIIVGADVLEHTRTLRRIEKIEKLATANEVVCSTFAAGLVDLGNDREKENALLAKFMPAYEAFSKSTEERESRTLGILESVVGRVEAIESRLKPFPLPKIVKPAAQTRDGVPVVIYDQIAADAAKEWPGNFEMQSYQIKNQIEAYKKLHP